VTAGVLQDVISRDLEDFQGARVTGTVPVTERLINTSLDDALRRKPGRIDQIEIRILSDNRLQLGVHLVIGPFTKWFRPELILDSQALWSNAPVLVFTISESHYGALARLIETFASGALPPGVYIRNKQVVIDFRSVPQTQDYSRLFKHMRRLQITTEPQVLRIDFELQVE
jgi:hypothetical protein